MNKYVDKENECIVNIKGDISQEEAKQYIEILKNKNNARINSITIEEDGDFVNVDYMIQKRIPFERIRRITGYLVGDKNKWNDAKKAEEEDRVKHTITDADINEEGHPLISVADVYYALENGIIELSKGAEDKLCLVINNYTYNEFYSYYLFDDEYKDVELAKVKNIVSIEWLAYKAFNLFKNLQGLNPDKPSVFASESDGRFSYFWHDTVNIQDVIKYKEIIDNHKSRQENYNKDKLKDKGGR